MSFSGVTLIGGSAVAINVMSLVHEGRDPFPAALAGGMLVTGLAFLDEASSPLADGLATLFLVSTLLFRGVWFFGWLSSIVGPQQGSTMPTAQKPQSGETST